MTDLKLIVCDIAGTTLHDGDGVRRAFEAALSAEGLTAAPARIAAVMGLPKKIAVRQLLTEQGVAAPDDLVHRLHDDFVLRMKHHYDTDPGVREIDGASAFFADARRGGVKIALNTGFSADIVERILPRLGWSVPATVDAVIASSDVTRGRPYPDMIRHLQKMFGIDDPAAIAKIGDTVSDLDEGSSAGCGWNIGVLTGAASRAELAARPHTHIVPSIADVAVILFDSHPTIEHS
jgi:phosphonatase-like hydrolase